MGAYGWRLGARLPHPPPGWGRHTDFFGASGCSSCASRPRAVLRFASLFGRRSPSPRSARHLSGQGWRCGRRYRSGVPCFRRRHAVDAFALRQPPLPCSGCPAGLRHASESARYTSLRGRLATHRARPASAIASAPDALKLLLAILGGNLRMP